MLCEQKSFLHQPTKSVICLQYYISTGTTISFTKQWRRKQIQSGGVGWGGKSKKKVKKENPFVSPIVKGVGVGVQPWCIVKFKDLKVQCSKSGLMLVYEVNSLRGEIKSGADPGFAFRGGCQNQAGGKTRRRSPREAPGFKRFCWVKMKFSKLDCCDISSQLQKLVSCFNDFIVQVSDVARLMNILFGFLKNNFQEIMTH